MRCPLGAALAAVSALVAVSAPAAAFFVRPSVKQTLGSHNYAGTYAAVDAGDDLHFKPSFNSYHSDDATGTFKTWGIRGAYDFDKYGLALTGGFSPRVNGYANHYVGGEASISFDFEEGGADRAEEAREMDQTKSKSKRKFGVSRLDFTVGVTRTEHSDQFVATTNAQGKPIVSQSSTTLEFAQTDVMGTMAVEITKTRLEFDLTKSAYNKDIAFIGARAPQITFLSGLNAVIQGFPDLDFNARLELETWDVFTPWVSYTYTTFKVTQPSSAAYTIGLDGSWRDLSFSASYQRVAQAGGADRNYVSAETAYRFE